jgi:hypothetical protein
MLIAHGLEKKYFGRNVSEVTILKIPLFFVGT